MEIFRFDRDERLISAHGSIGLHATRVASGDGGVTVTCLAVRPGGAIGTHPASKPPSSDGLAKPAPKSLRGKSGRKPGRPKGQPGTTMQLSDHPDKRVGTGRPGAAAAGSP